MSANERASDRVFLAVLCGLGCVGAVIVWLATSLRGLGVAVDSVAYYSAARSLLAGHGYLYYWGEPYTLWGPLYPTVLAAFGLLGIDVTDGARVLSALCYGGTVVLAGLLLRRYVRSPLLLWGGIAAVVCSPALLESHIMAFSEPLFFVLVQAGLLLLLKLLDDPRLAYFWALTAVSALACVQRYAGVGLVVAFGLAMLVRWRLPLRTRLIRTVIFGALAGVPLALWALRNRLVSATVLGPRPDAGSPWQQTAYSMGETLSTWFLPRGVPYGPRVLAVVLLLAFLLAASVLIYRRAPRRADSRTAFAVTAVFFVVFAIFTYTAARATWIDDLGSRYLGPLFVPLIFLFVVSLDNLAGLSRRLAPVVTIAFALWLAYPAYWTMHRVGIYRTKGCADLLTVKWQTTPTLGWVEQHAAEGEIYSNRPEVFYVLRRVPVRYSPKRTESEAAFAQRVAANKATYLVWFVEGTAPTCVPLEDLARRLKLEELARYEDATIYRLRAAASL